MTQLNCSRIQITTLIIIILVFTNCTNSSKNKIYDTHSKFELNDFQIKEKLKGNKLELGTVLAPLSLFVNDSLLFVTSVGLETNVAIYNRNNNYKKIGDIIGNGQGPNEMLSMFKMIFDSQGSFWAYDVVSTQLKEFDLILNKDTVYANMKTSINFDELSVNQPIILHDKIVTTTHSIKPFTRFYVYDMDGALIETKAMYPKYDREIPNTAAVDVFNGYTAIHPKGSKFMIAYEYTDLVEFYDSDVELLNRVQGPHNFVPEFGLKERGFHTFMKRELGKTRQAYQAVSSSDEGVMLLYANGKTRFKGEGEEAIHFNHIIFIGWDGQPINYFELDHGVAAFEVDWDNRLIYGLDRITSEIYSFKF